MNSDRIERYYAIPRRVFKDDINMFEIISIIFMQMYKGFNNESVFTISTMLNTFDIEIHHRRIAHIKDCLIRCNDMGVVVTDTDVIVKADKNTFIRATYGDYFEEGFIAIHPIEFNVVLSAMNRHNNYNLLNVFMSIKQDTKTISYGKNSYTSSSISYKSLYGISGIKSPNNLQEAINILCDIGVIEISTNTSGHKIKHNYSFKNVNELNKINQPT
jgi:hypothetical protein